VLSKEEAFRLLSEHVFSEKKKRHMIAVSAIMKRLSKRLGMNEEEWELVGLLHDLDYDIIEGDMSRHGLVASKILEGKLPEECLHAIKAHDHRTGVKPASIMDKALIASDCIWGLIVRTALASRSRKIHRIKLDALKNKFKDDSFPKFLKKGIKMCAQINFTLEEFSKLALRSLPQNWTFDEADL